MASHLALMLSYNRCWPMWQCRHIIASSHVLTMCPRGTPGHRHTDLHSAMLLNWSDWSLFLSKSHWIWLRITVIMVNSHSYRIILVTFTVLGHFAKRPFAKFAILGQYFSNLWVHLVPLLEFFQPQSGATHYSLGS